LGLFQQASLSLTLLSPPPSLGISGRERNPESPGELLCGLGKVEVLHCHQELEGIAALVAAETIVEAFDRVDGKGGCLLLVERTEAFPASTLILQADMVRDQFDDVDGVSET